MTFIINTLSFVISIALASIVFAILYSLIMFMMKLINNIKKLIVWTFRNKITQITLSPAEKRYRRDVVETGYSMSYRYHSAPVYHYRYQTVFDGTYRNVIVRFANNIKIKINIKEESLLYQKLLNR